MRVIATAGHVDHGKSSLVLALTGTDPDRLAEEKARVVGTEAVAGGGSLPGLTIPSVGVALDVGNAQAALARLREWGVIARIDDDAIVCDLRTVDPADDVRLTDALAAIT